MDIILSSLFNSLNFSQKNKIKCFKVFFTLNKYTVLHKTIACKSIYIYIYIFLIYQFFILGKFLIYQCSYKLIISNNFGDDSPTIINRAEIERLIMYV